MSQKTHMENMKVLSLTIKEICFCRQKKPKTHSIIETNKQRKYESPITNHPRDMFLQTEKTQHT
jgi:hypothetical protein